VNNDFFNAISGMNIVNATNSSAVVMNNSAGYELVSGKINVDSTSTLAITSAIKDQSSPTTAISSITKVGDGPLTLSGANTYSGETNIQAGSIVAGAVNTLPSSTPLTVSSGASLQMNDFSQVIGSLSGAGSVVLGSGNLTTGGNDTTTEFSGLISGDGGLTKVGVGAFTLSGANTFSGDTNINAGSVVLTGSINSNTSIAASANLLGNGVINGNLNNSGSIIPSFNGAASNLTVNGSYVGNNGTFIGGVYAPVTNPVADSLSVSGNVTGFTGLTITDKGGLGNRTAGDGIPVIIVNGNSTDKAFALNQRVASGAYEYKLYKGGASGSGDSWYLSTQAPEPAGSGDLSGGSTPAPLEPVLTPAAGERIEVAVYPAVPSLMQLYAQTAVDTLDQRRGDLNFFDAQGSSIKTSKDWARVIGKTGKSTPSNVNDGPSMSFNAYAVQFGIDVYSSEEQDGSRSYAGPYVTIGSANANTSSQATGISTGSIKGMQAYSLGLYGTHFSANGLYVDALVQGTRYLNVGASSVQNAQIKTQGSGFTGSLEGGARWNIDKFLISPQAQIVHDAINMNNANDDYGQMSFKRSKLTRGRLGLLAGRRGAIGITPIFAYLRASYWNIFNAGTSTSMASLYGVNPVSFESQANSRWLTVDAEVNARLTKATNLFINFAVENSLMGTYETYSGRIGLQTRF
jgi:outer membrane autotransporter protein